MSSMNKHRSLDDSIMAYIGARPGQLISSYTLSKHFEVDARIMKARLTSLAAFERVSTTVVYGKRHYYIPTPEQIAERNREVEAKTSYFKPYVVPQPMRELMARIAAERDAHPSHYGNGNPQQWKARQV